MIVELIFTLAEDDYPYGPPFSTIVEEIDTIIGDHCDSGTSFIEPLVREIGWEAKDLTEVDLMTNSIQSVLDRLGGGLTTEVVVRTCSEMLNSPLWDKVDE